MNKKVFLTGATGTMGWAGFLELIQRRDRFDITLLARPSKKNKNKLRPYLNMAGVHVIWGDLLSYQDVLQGVTGADYVLHVGGMVSPLADKYPQKTMKVNIGSAQNIVKAVQSQPNKDEIGVVYIGSVAQTGSYLPPYHWGRCGDPINASVLDYYSLSKSVAEKVFAESGLRKWVSLRQSGILYPKLLMKLDDPIMFHVPFRGVLEWSTVEDSGRVLANVCEAWVPEEFWRRFYNLSSGPSYRLSNYEFESLLLSSISCPPVEKIFDLDWFATRNFHGQWYLDADILEGYLHFRANIPCQEYFKLLRKQVPWFFSLAPIVPAAIIKLWMKYVASHFALGPLYWLKHGNQERINAHFGSLQEWKAVGTWKDFDASRPSDDPILLSHGYDESKAESELGIEDMQEVAAFHGGKCLSEAMAKGDMFTPLEWECASGHKFSCCPNTILKGGHWCPECLQVQMLSTN